MTVENLAVFALNATHDFGERVTAKLAIALTEHEEREFEDGEHKARPLVSIRAKDTYIIQSLYSDERQSVNDKLCRLLFFAGALRDAGAERVTAVIPYLAYARKERKTQPRDPVTTRYVASLIEAVGVDRVVTMDVHDLAAFQNAFRCRTEHLEAAPLFLQHLLPELSKDTHVVVVSPDVGGIKRAERLRKGLARVLRQEVPAAFVEKARAKGVVSFGRLIGDVTGTIAVILDDLISTGGTLANAAKACKDRGATKVYAAASHGLFVGYANEALATDELDRVIVTDTVPTFRLDPELVKKKVVVLSAAALFAEAIRRLHTGGSLVELLHPL
jgi:ribose-phosphate pyrophosphokinase